MSSKKFGIQKATFGSTITIGRLNSQRTAFADKEDATDEVLFAVADYVREHFDGAMEMTFASKRPGHADLRLRITCDEVAR